jgi:SOS-response transcriptional repressor LexA
VTRRAGRHAAPIYAFIVEFVGEHGYGPTFREIQAACDIPSQSGVAYHLDKLEAAKRITIQRAGIRRSSRGIRIVGGEPVTIAHLYGGYQCPETPSEVEQRMADVIGEQPGDLVFIPKVEHRTVVAEAVV